MLVTLGKWPWDGLQLAPQLQAPAPQIPLASDSERYIPGQKATGGCNTLMGNCTTIGMSPPAAGTQVTFLFVSRATTLLALPLSTREAGFVQLLTLPPCGQSPPAQPAWF